MFTGKDHKLASHQEVILWISRAWGKVNSKMEIKSIKSCGIGNDLDGNEDDMLSENMVNAFWGC